ncbi:hypothetical protein KAI87_11155 [Myxococcota bacterium]|nr:hypothetical protein [Myxococcota bacterium]
MQLLLALALATALSTTNYQAPGMAPGMAPSMAPGQSIKLKSSDLKAILEILPEVAKAGAELSSPMGRSPNSAVAQEKLLIIQKILEKYEMNPTEFFLKYSTMMLTWMAISKPAFDLHILHKNDPIFDKLMQDPKLPAEQKEAIQTQLAFMLQNEEAVYQQLTQSVTPHNRMVVGAWLGKIDKAITDLQKLALQKSKKKSGVK